MKHYDVIVIGGGPAGSTVATLVKKYSPHMRILLLEKSRFPRHHVGESLLAGATPVLLDMEAYDKVNTYGFVEKIGATYVWGRNRAPWGFSFEELLENVASHGQSLPSIYTKAWQVRRAEYDHLLLQHTESMSVEVLQEARVVKIVRTQDDHRVTGVEYQHKEETQSVSCAWLMDCSGQDALIGRELSLRDYDEHMNNYALFGYWKNAKWKFEYLGYPQLTRIFVATTPRGWIWYIPVSKDTVSVGLVTHRQTLKQMSGGPEQLYREEVASSPEIQDLVQDAYLVRISDDQTRDVCAVQDWSYTNRQMTGPGWATAGDAAGFVDPILSSGVMLAHELGQKAAYTINSSFKAHNDDQIASYWKFYEETYHTYLHAYRTMASFWYSNNFSMESWWWQAQREINQQEDGLNLTNRDAFTRLAFGYASRAESLSLFGSYPVHEARQLVDALFGSSTNSTPVESLYDGRPLRLKGDVKVIDGMYYYQGFIRTTKRVVGEKQRYLDLHPGEDLIIRLLDGSHTLSELNSAISEFKSLEAAVPIRNGIDLLVQLNDIGALAMD